MKEAATTERTSATGRITPDRIVSCVVLAAGLFFLVFGSWAFAAPRSFFDNFAEFEPYNRHLIHDIGAFQIGLGAVLLIALFVRDAIATALAGAGVGMAVHAVSHIIDHELGGSASDTVTFAVFSAVLLTAAGFRYARLNGKL